jgi:hypothetical protein
LLGEIIHRVYVVRNGLQFEIGNVQIAFCQLLLPAYLSCGLFRWRV